MIERYTRPEMARIWHPQHRTQKWLEVELAVCDGLAEYGYIPREAAQVIRERARFDLQRMAELEKETRHDVMAFVRNVEENVGAEGRYVHYGITSYDVVDTALALLLRDSCDQLLSRCQRLREVIARLAKEHKHTPMIGRTHGVHAEPITFGFKLAGWYDEMGRNQQRLEFTREMVSVGKISGAVGIHANVDPRVEEYVCAQLGLRPAPASTQIISRDVHATYLSTLSILAASLERFATELRNLQRTEILEVQEYFAPGQTGSSAMPHKRNPWNCETVSGLARVVRGYLIPALENIATWHERDLTNSSVERIILPDASILVDWMLWKLTDILEHLAVFPDNMMRNLQQLRGLVFSEQVMLALVNKGLSREQAYKLVQRNAAKAWEGADFQQCLKQDEEVRRLLREEEIDQCFDLQHHLRYLDVTFQRLGLE
ncbi:MAG: adenylosuccinate lyase [Armatimonadota bacterium]|nr:adenylosuccinate lyase [bacterium]MDW8104220.1 adenylosuccinate lyase [Armatimonadota bacterium]MDW8290132.1 adenylosuccinate lyase [Armatimonadota bacterium]